MKGYHNGKQLQNCQKLGIETIVAVPEIVNSNEGGTQPAYLVDKFKYHAQSDTVRFKYKDYHHRGTEAEHKEMTISIDEFIRRFEQHILPFRYVRIRRGGHPHYGYLQNHGRAKRLKGLFEKLNLPQPPAKVRIPVYVTIREKYGVDIRICPKCKENHLELVATHYRDVNISQFEKPKNKASPAEF